jgi:hypothetical protein
MPTLTRPTRPTSSAPPSDRPPGFAVVALKPRPARSTAAASTGHSRPRGDGRTGDRRSADGRIPPILDRLGLGDGNRGRQPLATGLQPTIGECCSHHCHHHDSWPEWLAGEKPGHPAQTGHSRPPPRGGGEGSPRSPGHRPPAGSPRQEYQQRCRRSPGILGRPGPKPHGDCRPSGRRQQREP